MKNTQRTIEADKIINAVLSQYRVEIVMTHNPGSWMRVFVYAPDIRTARYMAKKIKTRFVSQYASKRAKTIVEKVSK